MRVLFAAVAALALTACEPAGQGSSAGEAELETDEQKMIYALGHLTAGTMGAYAFQPDEVEVLVAGMREALNGEEPRVDLREAAPAIRDFLDARANNVYVAEVAAGEAFASEAGARDGAEVADSGLVYIETQAGSGASPGPNDRVRVHYHGTLRDGTVFDSSVERGEPASFPLNGVIRCWTEALQKMQVGGKAEIYCPESIAYGKRATGSIPSGATLRFDVELLEIE